MNAFRRWLANPFGFAPTGSPPGTLGTLDVTQVGLFATAVYGALRALAPVIPGGPQIVDAAGAVIAATTAVVALWHRFAANNQPAAS